MSDKTFWIENFDRLYFKKYFFFHASVYLTLCSGRRSLHLLNELLTCPTWSSAGRSLRTAAATAPSLGRGRPACHSERSAAPRSLLHADVTPTGVYAGRRDDSSCQTGRGVSINDGSSPPPTWSSMMLLCFSSIRSRSSFSPSYWAIFCR